MNLLLNDKNVVFIKEMSKCFEGYSFFRIRNIYCFQCTLLILCRYVAAILKMCMKQCNAEINIFDKFTAF